MDTTMKVSKITVKNLLGIESLEFSPGAVTVIRGKNGSGKTSVLDAIRAAVGGGHDATLLRKGSKRGQVVLELEDGAVITKDVSEDRSDLTVELPNVGKVSRKQAYIDSLVDSLGMNPIDFLFAPDKRRVDLLMQSAAVSLDVERLRSIEGSGMLALPAQCDPFNAIDLVRRKLYDERTGVNRVARELRASVAAMQNALPPVSGDDWETQTAHLEQRLAEAKREAQSKVNEAKRQGAERDLQIREEFTRKLEALRRQLEEERDGQLERARAELDATLETLRDLYQPLIDDCQGRLVECRTQAQAERDAAKAREYIERQTEKARQAEIQADELTHGLEQLDALKSELLAGLPVSGLEIREGQILVDGLPFDRVNEARRIRIAIEIAKLRAGRLGLLLVDGMERLDETSFREFVGAVQESGLQAIVCRVSETELTVGEEEAA